MPSFSNDSDQLAIDMETGWYAVHTRSNFEKRIVSELTAKGMATFLPVAKEIHQWKDRKKVVEIPVFSGYVFVRMYGSAEEQLRVLQTAGAIRILGTGAGIERIPEGELEAIRLLVNAGVPFLGYPFLKQGCPVRVRRGPLEGVEGLLVKIKNHHRVVVSIQLLSQSVSAEVDAHSVEPVPRGIWNGSTLNQLELGAAHVS